MVLFLWGVTNILILNFKYTYTINHTFYRKTLIFLNIVCFNWVSSKYSILM